jgi:hypothetical protein
MFARCLRCLLIVWYVWTRASGMSSHVNASPRSTGVSQSVMSPSMGHMPATHHNASGHNSTGSMLHVGSGPLLTATVSDGHHAVLLQQYMSALQCLAHAKDVMEQLARQAELPVPHTHPTLPLAPPSHHHGVIATGVHGATGAYSAGVHSAGHTIGGSSHAGVAAATAAATGSLLTAPSSTGSTGSSTGLHRGQAMTLPMPGTLSRERSAASLLIPQTPMGPVPGTPAGGASSMGAMGSPFTVYVLLAECAPVPCSCAVSATDTKAHRLLASVLRTNFLCWHCNCCVRLRAAVLARSWTSRPRRT